MHRYVKRIDKYICRREYIKGRVSSCCGEDSLDGIRMHASTCVGETEFQFKNEENPPFHVPPLSLPIPLFIELVP